MCLCGTPYGAPSQRHHGEAGALFGQRLTGDPGDQCPKIPQTFFEAFPQPQEYEQFTEVHISYH